MRNRHTSDGAGGANHRRSVGPSGLLSREALERFVIDLRRVKERRLLLVVIGDARGWCYASVGERNGTSGCHERVRARGL